MSSQSEHQAIASQQEALRSAVEALNGKLDAQESRLAAELSALRCEIEVFAQQLESLRENTAVQEVGDDTASQRQPALPVDDAPRVATPAPGEFDFARAGFSPSSGEGDVEKLLLGPELAALESLHGDRGALIQGAFQQDPAALALIGQLMVFRGAGPERRPQLLKDLGEAFYRWRGATALAHDRLRECLVAYLIGQCEAAGSPVGVELVQVGDRYDAKRHHAKQRGVEVIGVEGWIVLRSDGRVYTKANVVLK